MKNNFRGWSSVFGFTFKQTVGELGYKLSTGIVALLIIVAIIAVNLIVANESKDKAVKVSPIENVYVQDNSGLAPTAFSDFIKSSVPEAFGHIKFEDAGTGSRSQIIEGAGSSSKAIVVFIQAKDNGYEMEAVIPSKSEIKTKQAKALLKEMISAFETSKLVQSGMSKEQLTMALSPIVTTHADIGESANEFVNIVKMIAPMLFGLLLYTMLLLYGQIISKSVSTEKTSKLMETLLTTIHPYALIGGKILGVAATAILQFSIWVASVIIGLFSGIMVTERVFPEYNNSVTAILDFIRANLGEMAFSLPSVILAFIFILVGFLFYCVLAGLAGCMVSKPEEAASTQTIFQLPIIISFLVSYFAPLYGKENIVNVARYVPFTSPFSVPVDLLTGTMSLLQGGISLVILFAFSIVVIMLSGRIYKGLLLYTGQKVTFKLIGDVIKSNK